MIGAFILGIAIIIIWGIQAGVHGANAFASFFSSLGLLLNYPAIAIILIMVLIVSLIKVFYYVISFFAGLLIGLCILMALGSPLTGILSFIYVIRVTISISRGDAKAPLIFSKIKELI